MLERCKTRQEAAELMNLVKTGSLRKLLSQNLTSEMLMAMVGGVDAGVAGGACNGMNWLETLPRVSRFDIIVEFLSEAEKATIRRTVDKLVEEGAPTDKARAVREAFHL